MSAGRVGVYLLILAASLASARYFARKTGPRGARPPVAAAPARSPDATPAAPAAPPSSAPSSAPMAPPNQVLSEAFCPADMVYVGAASCATYSRKCSRKEGPDCVAFQPAGCRPGQALRFCVDRYEYPNVSGMLPATVVTFAQARMACEAEGKRLCSEAEWALACEGPGGFAFSYGDELERGACNTGHPLPRMAADALWEPRDVSSAVARVDARVPGGESERCVSPLGLHDMPGNVEEWVTSDVGYHGALRGGGFADSAPTCRTVRQMSDPSYRSVVTGFRCCRDPLVRAASPRPAGGPEPQNPAQLP